MTIFIYSFVSLNMNDTAPTNFIFTVLCRSGAHPNQMKQLRMILKAQEVYFVLHTSTIHKYEDDMTNSGQQDGTGAEGNLLCGCHIAVRCSSCHLHTCGWLRCGVQSRPPGLSESSLVVSFAWFGWAPERDFLCWVSPLKRNGEGIEH